MSVSIPPDVASDGSNTTTGLRSHVRWLWPYVRLRWRGLALVLGLSTVISVAATAQPWLTKYIIDDGLIAGRADKVLLGCAVIVGIAVFASLAGGFNRWLYVRLSGSMLSELREHVFMRLLAQPPEFFRGRAVGDLVTRLDGDIAEVQRFSTDTLLAVVGAILGLAAAVVVMLHLSPLLTLVAAASLPLQLALRHSTRARVRRNTEAVREKSSEIAHFFFERLSSVKGVQAATTEAFEHAQLQLHNREILDRIVNQQMVSYATGAISTLLGHVTTACVFVVGGHQVLDGTLTVGTLVAFVAYLARGNGSALSILSVFLAYQRASVSLSRVRALAELDPGARYAREAAGAESIDVLPRPASIEFQELCYTPPAASTPLFNGLDWRVSAGDKVVLRGPSGAGKSSLVDLLRRFAVADSGSVRVAGQPVERFSLTALRRGVFVLETQPALFRGTVEYNLRYGFPDATDADVRESARRAGVDQIVSALPSGYATPLGAAGHGLSAGERQRIAIARALLARPAVVILDEAASNLDASAVAGIHALVDAHFADCTRIVITHVETDVPGASSYWRLREGRIARDDRPHDPGSDARSMQSSAAARPVRSHRLRGHPGVARPGVARI